MGKIIYVTGGARSGKSSFAEKIADKYESRAYIATAIAFDEEMRDRIARHREQRGGKYTTFECQKDLKGAFGGNYGVYLMDCATVFVSNLMLDYTSEDKEQISLEEQSAIEERAREQFAFAMDFIHNGAADMIIVSNEVGMGVVPAYPMGRMFRDIAGRTNRFIAENADECYFIVSGMPMRLK